MISELEIVLRIITILFVLPLFYLSLVRLIRGNVGSANIVIIVFCFSYVFPLLLDVFFGIPNYELIQFKGFQETNENIQVTIIYCFYVTLFLYLFFFFSKRNTPLDNYKLPKGSKISFPIQLILAFLVTCPLLLSIFKVSDLSLLVDYFYLAKLYRSNNFLQMYYLTFVSVFSFIAYCLISRQRTLNNLLIFAFPLFVCLSVNGKRTIIAYLIFLLFFIILLKKEYSLKKVFILGIISFVFLIGVSFVYQNVARGFDFGNIGIKEYLSFRIDFGREDVLKMAISANLNEEEIIKDQNISFFYFLNFFNSSLGEVFGTPYKYSVYATSHLLGISVTDLGWGMTTGLFDEAISNFGLLFGFLVPLVFYSLVTRMADNGKSKGFLMITYLFCTLTMLVQITAIAIVILCWFLYALRIILKIR